MMTIALDTETTGLDLYHGARPYLVTTAWEDGTNRWWEFDVDPLTRRVLPTWNDLHEIADVLREADVIVLQNAKFDYTALRLLYEDKNKEMPWDWSKVRDTLYAGHLLGSAQPHDLTSMALIYLRVDVSKYERAVEAATKEALAWAKKKGSGWRLAKAGLPEMPSAKEKRWKYDMWLPRLAAKERELPEEHAWWNACADYANSDSTTTLHLWKRQEAMLETRHLRRIYDERLRLLPVICDMERQGVTLSATRVQELVERYVKESMTAERKCLNIAKGLGYDLVLPKGGVNGSLTTFLLEKLGLPTLAKTPKGKPSMGKAVLEQWEEQVKPKSKAKTFLTALLGKRKRDTGVSYLESYRRFWRHVAQEWYVLHPSLNATGTHTLRMSSNNPNEQNISKQENFNLRYVFGPARGREWWSLDYENIELRIPAYESGEQVMIDLFEKPDDPPFFGSYHLMNASIIYPDLFWPLVEEKGVFKKKYASTWYQWCKNFGFAVQYGAVPESGTADKAARKNGSHRLVMDRLKEHTKLNNRIKEFASKHGYVETIPDKTVDPSRGYPIQCLRTEYGSISPTIPLNYHVQSTAMWCTMKAMIRCQEYLQTLPKYHIALQVHDEMVFDFPAGGKRNLPKVRRLRRLMEQSGDDIGIPLRVSVSYHPNNWSEETGV